MDSLSNYDEKGSWWFLVGPISYPNDIIQPHNDAHLEGLTQEAAKKTCETHGLSCHVTAHCLDTETGFCCRCRDGYYGNGFTCVKSDAPIRVAGRISGSLGEELVDTQMQAYVSLQDGQTYAAITPLEPSIGQKLQLLHVLAGPIGWLFAVPTAGAQNGYQLTGGKFNHSSTVRFHGSDRQITVTQTYTGMNVWDQLEVDVVVAGDLPDVPTGSRVVYPDIVEEFVYSAEDTLRSIGTQQVTVDDVELLYSIIQQITYEKCPFADEESAAGPADRASIFNKVFRVTSAFSAKESALRIGMSNKVTLNRDSSACTDGTAKCGDNTVCIAAANDSYDVSVECGVVFVQDMTLKTFSSYHNRILCNYCSASVRTAFCRRHTISTVAATSTSVRTPRTSATPMRIVSTSRAAIYASAPADSSAMATSAQRCPSLDLRLEKMQTHNFRPVSL